MFKFYLVPLNFQKVLKSFSRLRYWYLINHIYKFITKLLLIDQKKSTDNKSIKNVTAFFGKKIKFNI